VFRFDLAGIPVLVQPWFFLTAALIGPRDLPGLALWLPVAFAGVLAHELGHAFAIRRFGFVPAIQLHGMGGVTGWRETLPLTPARKIAISAAGPGVGIALGLGALLAASALAPLGPTASRLVTFIVWVNLGWGVLNLLPVLPLDGGMIVAAVTGSLWAGRGVRIARWASLAICGILAVAALAVGWYWSAVIFGVLAFSNYQALRASRTQEA
jgi:Zn-dependent protease